mgnify:CR=1 FL=1
MNQPIFELEIVNKVMLAVREGSTDFYQKEFSDRHLEICSNLRNYYNRKRDFEKPDLNLNYECNASLPFCQGEYLIPVLEKLKDENMEYYEMAQFQILDQFFRRYNIGSIETANSFLEQLFLWLEQVILTCKEVNNKYPDQNDLKVVFNHKLESLLEKQKTYKK